MIALLTARDPGYDRQAARRGVFAYIIDTTPESLQSALDITLQRFTEHHSLQGAFERRAEIEQAKGTLMAHHAIDADRRSRRCARVPNTAAASSPTSPTRSRATCGWCRNRERREALPTTMPGTIPELWWSRLSDLGLAPAAGAEKRFRWPRVAQ